MAIVYDIESALEVLRGDDVVALPTETVYGLAARVSSESAVQRIFELKKRPLFDPLIVHISKTTDISKYVLKWGKAARILAEKFWPGPLTIVAPKNPDTISDLITAGLPDVGIRMPNHSATLALINDLGEALAAPSANLFSKTSPTCPAHVATDFPNVMVLDGGNCEVGIESTVIRISEDNLKVEISVLRLGMISKQEIETALRDADLEFSMTVGKGREASPGQGSIHYQMKDALFIVPEEFEDSDVSALLKDNGYEGDFRELKFESKDPLIVARNLYSAMHELSAQSERLPATFRIAAYMRGEHWEAILDRISRASQREVE